MVYRVTRQVETDISLTSICGVPPACGPQLLLGNIGRNLMCQPVYTYKSQATKSKSTHSPLFDIQLPSNSSYVVTLEFSAPESSSSSSRGEAEFFSNPSSLRPTLTLVVESKSHHVFLFYLKVTIQIWPKKVCLRLRDPACWRSGEITQPRTQFIFLPTLYRC